MAIITGKCKPLMDWLRKLGIDPVLSKRVVIDIQPNSAVLIYATLLGTDEMLNVEPPPELLEAKVVVLGKPSD